MATNVITCPSRTWTKVSEEISSFQILNDRDAWFTKSIDPPTGVPPHEEPASRAQPGEIYNFRPVAGVGDLYIYPRGEKCAVNVAVNSPVFYDVFVQDQTSPPIEHWLAYEEETVTIVDNVLTGGNSINLNAGAGSGIVGIESNGYFLEIRYVDQVSDPELIRFYQAEIITYTDNVTYVTVEMDTPLDFDLDTTYVESAYIVDVNAARLSATATTTSRIRMRVFPPDNLSWDITRQMITAVTDNSPDDGKFLGGAALTWGIYFGFENAFFRLYLANIKANAGFRASAYDVNYTTRTVPQGTYGVSIRKSFAGQDKYGVTVRLNGLTDDNYVAYLQEGFTANATDLRFKIMGHIVD